MLYALWTIVGLLAAILLVQIVALTSRINYGSAVLSVIQQLRNLHDIARWQTDELSRVIDKMGSEIQSELRDLKPDWKEHRELINAIENIGADDTRIGKHLADIGYNVQQTENNTGPHRDEYRARSPSTDGMVWDTDLPAKT